MQSMKRMNPWQRFYWKQQLTSPMGSFGPKFLNMTPVEYGGTIEFVESSPASSPVISRMRTRLPAWCAREDGRAPVGALLAILDQCSTFGGLAEFHSQGRAGLSVSLSGSVVDGKAAPCLGADAPLVVETKLLKCGKTLAFLDVLVRCGETDELLLRGRHSKFLKLSLQHDITIHSPLRHLTLPILERVTMLDARHDYRGDDAAPESVFDFRRDGDTGDDLIDITRSHCNGIGGLHGGAACMIAELGATRAAPEGGPPTSMAVSLMTALRHGSTARVRTEWASPLTAQVTISDEATGAPCYDVAVGFQGRGAY